MDLRLNKKIILKAIYKHKALSIDQLKNLFGIKSRSTIATNITRLRANNLIFQLRTLIGTFYFLTTKGAKLINLERVNRINSVNKRHTDYEILTIRHLINSQEINPNDYSELLESYETEREIKRRKFSELGGQAHKLRWIDLLVKTKEGLKAYEIEITKKYKYRYKPIVAKLDAQFKKDKWIEIVWICFKKDYKWLSETIISSRPTSTMSLQIIENMKG